MIDAKMFFIVFFMIWILSMITYFFFILIKIIKKEWL